MKILVAEDEPISRLLMQRTLGQFGYEVIIAENGREAAEILSEPGGPRLALVDWMMPELDGPGLCRQVRLGHYDGPYVYIILLTSKQNSEDVVAGLEAGADDYLTKPCAPAELRARLRTGRRILELEDKLIKAREQMRYKATHDSLTGLLNRATILTSATQALRRSTHPDGFAALLLCDVDHFKRINDTHGHAVGDAVLREIARRFTACVRTGDAVGRYGGEEFLIILTNCSRSSAENRMEEIREAVATAPVCVGPLTLPVTVSVGSVICDDTGEIDVDAVLAYADAALYRAKAQGRDQIVVANDLVLA